MKGYDIDGVITRGVTPSKEDIIISGRGYDYLQETLKELEGIEFKGLYLAPYRQDYIEGKPYLAGAWKAEMIGRLGITEFYEDDPIQEEVIKNQCPNVNVIKV